VKTVASENPQPRLASRLHVVTPTPLRQQVVEILRKAITECVLEPGGRLSERELCAMLGVSRTTLREGLRQLEGEGLLEIYPNKAPVIVRLNEAETRAVYQVRRELEGLACELAAHRATSADFVALAQEVNAMEQAIAQGDFFGLQHAKTQFYDRLYDCGGNGELAHVLKRLRVRVTLIRGLNVDRAVRDAESLSGARAILKALRRRAPEAARRAATQHIDRVTDLAVTALRTAVGAERDAPISSQDVK